MTDFLRKGLMATSLSAALLLGGAAFAQTATPQEDASHRSASPTATPSTMPDQDNAARPMPDKDNDSARQKDRDRDQDRDRDRAAAGMNDRDTNQREIKIFDDFLDSHPEIAKDLEKDPSRVNDAGWVSNHKELQRFLEDHPKVREELKENPSVFMNREKKNEKSEQKY